MSLGVYLYDGIKSRLIHGAGAPLVETPTAPPTLAAYGTSGTPAEYPLTGTLVFVAPTGNDSSGTGAVGSPYATIKKAASVAPANSTIVVRAGVYHEGGTGSTLGSGIVVANNNVTIQNYPGETVWLDGSQVVTGWSSYDTNKYRAAVAIGLDRAPTQVRGEQVSGWGSFLMAQHPIAHWPEMVFLDGVPLTQVQTLAEVGPGKFFVQGSYPNGSGTWRNLFVSTHYVLGDNPAGKEVRIGVLSRAAATSRTGTRIRGIGFRRYSNTMPDWGCLYVSGAELALENVTFEDISDYAVHVAALNPTFRHCNFHRIGRKAIGTTYADGGLVEWCDFWQTNISRFNYGPDGGAIKVVRTWDFDVRFNRFRDNRGHGVWYDESCYRGAIHGNWYTDNYGTAALLEIGADQLVVDNIFVDSGINSTDVPSNRQPHNNPPIRISSSARIKVWHNTIINPERGLGCGEGWRKPNDPDSFGHDPRQPASFYDTVMTWNTEDIDLANNVFAGCAGISAIQSSYISFYDENNIKGTEDFSFKPRKNLYARPDSNHPARFALGWVRGGGASVYFSPTGAPYNAATTWNALTSDTSTFITADVIEDRTRARIRPVYTDTITPEPVPADVQALLDQSPFTAQRIGAGHIN